jgi:hypothetical protein
MAAVFVAGAQNFSKEYSFWNSSYINDGQFVYTYSDGFANVGMKGMYGSYSIALIRTDLNGDTLFTKTLFDTLSKSFLQRSGPDLDGYHYLAFHLNDSACVARFSPDWDLQWIQKFGLVYRSVSLTINRNNDLLINGIEINSGKRLHLYCLTSSGNTIWQKSIIPQDFESPISILELENGDIIVPVQEYDGFEMIHYGLNIYYFSPTGDSLSYKSVPLTGMWPMVCEVITNNDTMAIIYINRYTQGNAYHLMHYRLNGTLISEKEITLFDSAYGIHSTLLTPDHKILAAGIKAGPDIDFYSTFIYAMTFNGDSLWSVDYGNNLLAEVSDIQLCHDGGYIVSGNYGSSANRIVTLLKTDSLGNLNNLATEQHSISDRISVYPNPANEYTVFETQKSEAGSKLTLCDITGRQVAQQVITSEKTVLPTAHLEAGLYLYRIENGQVISMGKVMVVK